MKRIGFLLLITMILLMACSSNDTNETNSSEDNVSKSSNSNLNTSESEENDSVNTSDNGVGFKEIDLIDVDGIVSNHNFQLDEDGDTMRWEEKDSFLSNESRPHVWLDGEVVALDLEKIGDYSLLTPSGKVASYESEDQIYSIIVFDPRTGEVEEFTKDDGNRDIIIPTTFNLREDPLVFTDRRQYTDGLKYFVWYLESNEMIDIDMTEWIESEVGEIKDPQYATVMLSTTGEKVHVAHKEGIFQYDIATKEIETLLTEEDNMLRIAYTTADDKYLIYLINDQDDNFNQPIYAMDLETKEKFEIAIGRNPHMLDNGNVFYQDQNELYVYDFETRESHLLYTVELEENEELKFVTISQDMSTLAYAYEIDLDEGEEVKIRVLRR